MVSAGDPRGPGTALEVTLDQELDELIKKVQQAARKHFGHRLEEATTDDALLYLQDEVHKFVLQMPLGTIIDIFSEDITARILRDAGLIE